MSVLRKSICCNLPEMHYNLLVADDNLIECDAAAMILKKLPQTGSIITCEDGDEALKILQNNKIDVVFSDINMPGLSGLNVLKNLTSPPPFVFITSYADYAVEGFNLDAIDFVLKPVTFERLKKAAEKAFEYIALKAAVRNNSPAGAKEIIVTGDPADDHFFIRETKGITRLRYSQVLYIESMGDFSKIHKTDGQSHIILSGLKSLEGQLPDSLFKRVHKQHIINMEHLQTIARGEVFLTNRTNIPVSTAYKEGIIAAFINKDPIKRN